MPNKENSHKNSKKIQQDSIPHKTYIVAARTDGLGERLCALLNAMAVSKLSGLAFRFSWINPNEGKNLNNNQVLMPFANFPTKQQLFQNKFIQKYDIGDAYHTLVGILGPFSLKWLQQENHGIVYIHQDFLKIQDVEVEKYRSTLAECFWEISFTPKIQNLINFTRKCAENFQEQFTAIHIRGGDFVYQPTWETITFNDKATNVYLALEIARIELEAGKSVVLFSDDLKTAQTLKKILTPKGKIYSIDDFFERTQYLGYEQSLFEILFMSFAEKIYSGSSSGFSRIAAMIGNKPKVSVYDCFTDEQKIKIIHNYFFQFQSQFHPAQQALALMQLFIFGQNCSIDTHYLLDYIQTAYQLFPKTSYGILYLFALLQNREYAKANTLLEQFYNERGEFLKMLSAHLHNKFVFGFSFAHYFTNTDISAYPYLSYFAFRIAMIIYPSSLEYKLAIPNIQLILCYLGDINLITQFFDYIQESGNFQEIYPILSLIKQNLETFNNFVNLNGKWI